MAQEEAGAGRARGFRPSIGGADGALCAAGVALAVGADWCSRDLGMASYGPAVYQSVFYFSLMAGFAALLAMSALGRRLSAWFLAGPSAVPLCALCAAGAAGALLKSFGALAGLGSWSAYLGASVAAVATAAALMAWLAACCADHARNAPILFPAAFVAVALAYLGLRSLGAAAASALIALMPLVSAGLFAFRRARTDEAEGGPAGRPDGADSPGDGGPTGHGAPVDAAEPTSRDAALPAPDAGGAPSWTFPWAPVVLMVVYSFDFFFSLALSVGPSPFGSVGMLAAGLAALGAVAAAPTGRPSRFLFRAALPCMLLGLLLLAYLDVGHACAVMFTSAGLYAFLLFLDIELCEMCHHLSIDAVWMFGLVEAFSKLASAVGRPAGQLFVGAFPVGSQGCGLAVAALVVATTALSTTLVGGGSFSAAFGLRRAAGASEGQADGRPGPVMTYNERLVWECSKASRLFGLTQREEEVLELLVQGLSIPDVAERACVSRSTAKTHINHIYKKLDVHSRDEAAALVRRVAQTR